MMQKLKKCAYFYIVLYICGIWCVFSTVMLDNIQELLFWLYSTS